MPAGHIVVERALTRKWKAAPVGAASDEQTQLLSRRRGGRARARQEPNERDDTPPDQGIDRHRHQRLRLENRSAFLGGVENAVEGRYQRPGHVVHEADKWSRIRAEQLEHEANRDQNIDKTDDPPHGLDSTRVAAALAVNRSSRGRRGRYGRNRRNRPHWLACRRLLSDDLAIV